MTATKNERGLTDEEMEVFGELKRRIRASAEAYLASPNIKKLAECAPVILEVLQEEDDPVLVLKALTELYYEEIYWAFKQFPMYELVVDGKSRWFTLGKAGPVYDNGHIQVRFGTEVILNNHGETRAMTDADKKAISDAADEYSASK
ncbi:hypothetical protein HYX70_03010 [Candidatus Saccharibacteria bacterium]|nr:hypothetical protein [Candidatus Saccharibacteria bacterium]